MSDVRKKSLRMLQAPLKTSERKHLGLNSESEIT